jgi:hypothetical protein
LDKSDLKQSAKRYEGTDPARAKESSDTVAVVGELTAIVKALVREGSMPKFKKPTKASKGLPAYFTDTILKRDWAQKHSRELDRLQTMRVLMEEASNRQRIVQSDNYTYGCMVASAKDLAFWWGCSEPTADKTMKFLMASGCLHRRKVVYKKARQGTSYMLGRRYHGPGPRPRWSWLRPEQVVEHDKATGKIARVVFPALQPPPEWADTQLHDDQLYRLGTDPELEQVVLQLVNPSPAPKAEAVKPEPVKAKPAKAEPVKPEEPRPQRAEAVKDDDGPAAEFLKMADRPVKAKAEPFGPIPAGWPTDDEIKAREAKKQNQGLNPVEMMPWDV